MKNKAWLCLSVVLCLLGITAGCSRYKTITSNEITQQIGDKVAIVSSSLPDFDLDDLMGVSDYIFVGEVVEIAKSGKFYDSEGKSLIYTDIIVKVDNILFSKDKPAQIALRVLGGRVGNEVTVAENSPVFNLNEKALIFCYSPSSYGLAPFSPSPKGIQSEHYCYLSGGALGKWEYNNGIATSFGRNNNGDKEVFSIAEIEARIAVLHNS